MKKVLFITAALLAISTVAYALPPMGYMGLFADASHSICRVDPAAYSMFERWIWVKPGTAGV